MTWLSKADLELNKLACRKQSCHMCRQPLMSLPACCCREVAGLIRLFAAGLNALGISQGDK